LWLLVLSLPLKSPPQKPADLKENSVDLVLLAFLKVFSSKSFDFIQRKYCFAPFFVSLVENLDLKKSGDLYV
jgi:hypothetical protein